MYGAIHQIGGEEAGRPGLPARPYLGLSAEDEADLDVIIDDWASGSESVMGGVLNAANGLVASNP